MADIEQIVEETSQEVLREAGEALLKAADNLAQQETYKDTFGLAIKQGLKELLGIVFSQELDFLTKFLVVVFVVSFTLLLTYLAMPMGVRRRIEAIAYNAMGGGLLGFSGGVSILVAVTLGVQKLQKMSVTKD